MAKNSTPAGLSQPEAGPPAAAGGPLTPDPWRPCRLEPQKSVVTGGAVWETGRLVLTVTFRGPALEAGPAGAALLLEQARRHATAALKEHPTTAGVRDAR